MPLVFPVIAAVAVFGVTCAQAVPMTLEAAQQIPRMEKLVEKTRAKIPLSNAERAELYANVKSGDPVLSSLAAWLLARDPSHREANLKVLGEAEKDAIAVGAAFIKLAQLRLTELSDQERLARLRKLIESDNPYIQVEAAREITELDPAAGLEAFKRLATDQAHPGRSEIVRQLRKLDPQTRLEPVPGPTDDMYAIVLDVIRESDVLASHSLRGKTVQGEITSPFPASIEKLQFAWGLQPGAPAEPLEIQWVAADTAGVAPNNHVISSSKSDSGKTAGEFTLSKPTQGFPPGKYRVELRQAGKLIYTQDFIIR